MVHLFILGIVLVGNRHDFKGEGDQSLRHAVMLT